MTAFEELQADPSYDRHLVLKDVRFDAWVAVAEGLLANPGPLVKLSQSEIESYMIGLNSIDHPAAREARVMLQKLVKP